MKRAFVPAGLVLSLWGCGPGQTMVFIETDVRIPALLSRVRIDLHRDDRWFESRDFPLSWQHDRLGTTSFSLVNHDGTDSQFVVRVRGYVEGRLRRYSGERYAPDPTVEPSRVATNLGPACQAPPRLSTDNPVRIRVPGRLAADETFLVCGDKRTFSGLAAVEVHIDRPASYRLSLEDVSPGGVWAPFGDLLLVLRPQCAGMEADIACNAGEVGPGYKTPPAIPVNLQPGTVVALVGNQHGAPADVTLVLTAVDTPQAPPGPPATLPPDGTWAHLPLNEPLPALAIDKLTVVPVPRWAQTSQVIRLQGTCFGRMSDLNGSRTCEGGEMTPVTPSAGTAGAVALAPRDPATTPAEAAPWPAGRFRCPVGQMAARTIPDAPPHDERACVPGGAFLLGDRSLIAAGADAGIPERVAAVSSFLMDVHEYTVGRYRQARRVLDFDREPGAPPTLNNDGLRFDVSKNLERDYCTWNADARGLPVRPERESMPLVCVDWQTARRLCQLEGGDLPTVAQREYAAAMAGRPRETLFPWGDTPPDCAQAVHGRWPGGDWGNDACVTEKGFGPTPVHEPLAEKDRTPVGISGLGGNVSEWTLDSHRPYSDPCWTTPGPQAVTCWEEEAPLRTVMGGSWRSAAGATRASTRVGVPPGATQPFLGFRCVYRARPEGAEP
jgi:formylglycine-generating enzyme